MIYFKIEYVSTIICNFYNSFSPVLRGNQSYARVYYVVDTFHDNLFKLSMPFSCSQRVTSLMLCSTALLAGIAGSLQAPFYHKEAESTHELTHKKANLICKNMIKKRHHATTILIYIYIYHN